MAKLGNQHKPGGRLDALMNAAVDAIIIIDEHGAIEQFNRAAEQIFGYDAAEVVGKNVNILMAEPHSSRHDRYIKTYLETGKAEMIGKGRNENGLRKDGTVFPMLLSVGESRQHNKSHFVGIIRDMSEVQAAEEQVRQLEEQLLHADRLVILGELTAGIAHEINQPLTAIAAYADAGSAMLRRQPDTRPEDMQSVCERIGEQSRRAAAVIQRLRKLVRSGSVAKTACDINSVIRNILLLFEYEIKKRGTDLAFFPIESLPALYIDEIQIQQVLVNLVKNSLDALEGVEQRAGRIEIRVVSEDNKVLVSVTDNGPGVSEQNRGRLFEAFFTTKPKGVGLGLPICRSIAAAHGGNLQYAQPSSGGSCFTLSLPLEFIG